MILAKSLSALGFGFLSRMVRALLTLWWGSRLGSSPGAGLAESSLMPVCG